MKELNCFNFNTTLKSLSDIFNINKEELISFLQLNRNFQLSEDELFLKLQEEKEISTNYDSTIFFHLTRCNKEAIINIQKNGIYSTTKSYSEIISYIYHFDNHNMSKNEFVLYLEKVIENNKSLYDYINIDKGPYALLINDVNIINYHFLSEFQGSEMIEDIFKMLYQNEYRKKLFEYNKNTKPIIVIFRKNISKEKYLKTALYFLWCVISKSEWQDCFNRSIDFLIDYNMKVNPTDIIKIVNIN